VSRGMEGMRLTASWNSRSRPPAIPGQTALNSKESERPGGEDQRSRWWRLPGALAVLIVSIVSAPEVGFCQASNLALAPGTVKTQSSLTWGGVAERAADGNTNGHYWAHSVTHTNSGPNQWWQVDLLSPATISSIVIWPRTDCCTELLSNYWVFVSNTPFGALDTPATLQNRANTWSNYQAAAPSASSGTTLQVNYPGRYVRVQMNNQVHLSLAEVQVMGTWAGQSQGGFTDVSMANPRLYYNIDFMRLASLTRGCADPPLQFCPEATITRGQMSVFVIRALYWALNGSPEGFTASATPYFDDVPATDPFFRYIQKMRELGITSGCFPTQYCPGSTLRWGELAVFAARAWEIATTGRVTNAFSHSASAYFNDVQPGHAWFPYIQKVRELGVIPAGTNAGCAGDPQNYCTETSMLRGLASMFMVQGIMQVADARPKDVGGPVVASETTREHVRLGGEVIATEITQSVGGVGSSFGLMPASVNLLQGESRQFMATEAAQTWEIKKKTDANPPEPDSWYGSLGANGVFNAPATTPSNFPYAFPFSFGIQAVSAANPSKRASATVTLLSNTVSVQVTNGCNGVITSGQSCQFNASPAPVSWTVLPIGSGTINAGGLYQSPAGLGSTITVEVKATHSSGRWATQLLTIQPAPGGAVSISPSSINHAQSASSARIDVATTPGSAWSAAVVSGQSFVTLTGAVSGTGVGTVPYSVAANTGAAGRTATISVSGRLHTINQNGNSTTNSPPLVSGLAPLSGTGSTNLAFTGTYTDSNGATDISEAVLVISSSPLVLQLSGSCYVRYRRSNNIFTVADNQGNPDGVAEGNTTNSQCSLAAAGNPSTTGNLLQVVFQLNFSGTFAGNKSIWLQAKDSVGNTSGWHKGGDWIVPGGISINPASSQISDGGAVMLTASASPPGTINWSYSGQGQLTANGAAATYVAPTTISVGNSATVTATSPSCAPCSATATVSHVYPSVPVPIKAERVSGNTWNVEVQNPLSSGEATHAVGLWFPRTDDEVIGGCVVYYNHVYRNASLNESNSVTYFQYPFVSGVSENNVCRVYAVSPGQVVGDKLLVQISVDFLTGPTQRHVRVSASNRAGPTGWSHFGTLTLP
jgi:hypothetical protein